MVALRATRRCALTEAEIFAFVAVKTGGLRKAFDSVSISASDHRVDPPADLAMIVKDELLRTVGDAAGRRYPNLDPI